MNKQTGFLIFLAIALLIGCSSNPVYDNETIISLSQKGESRYGKSLHKRVLKATPLYKNRALSRYLNKIGSKLVSHLENNKIDIRIFILDTSNMRASALPGGYIYLTRGMLALLNNEDELAMVLGHEIAHVVNKDFKLKSRIKIEHDIELPEYEFQYEDYFKENSDVFDQYTKFSFGTEFAADKFSFELIQKAGFNVLRGINALRILKNYMDYYIGDENEPELFARYSHPNTKKRIARLTHYAKTHSQISREGGSTDSDYLSKIAGLRTGPSEQQGYFRHGYYINSKHRLRIDVPGDWNVIGYDEYVYLYNSKDNTYTSVYTYPNSIHRPIDKDYLVNQLDMNVTANLNISRFEKAYKATKFYKLSNGKDQLIHFVVLINKYDLIILKHVYFNESKPHANFRSVYRNTSLLKKSATHPELRPQLKLVKLKSGDSIVNLAEQHDMDVGMFKLINAIDNLTELRTRETVKIIQ